MDPITAALLNIGGMGVAAAALFVLHREALKAFQEQSQKQREAHAQQIKEDRDTNMALWKTYMDLKLKHHEEVLVRLSDIECGYKEHHK